ncbi:hypothetical protein [Cystobacter ferrugineus]|uniref:Uncharacterized protein n=1 Tax=Cystobacter ferrugineus TaxID=83449 RepID=A0A1L9BEL8_9BACT|nr:hypothetical protein [Cystobacter ferrugineus]OJH40704.1 hypothetical protein BON30_07095 [Cystobacter ferrugineus]
MSAPDDKSLPPLPGEAVRALEAFREERPSAHLENRIQRALQAAASGTPPARSRPPERQQRLAWLEHSVTRKVMGLALVTSVILLAVRADDWTGDSEVLSETMPLRHVSFQLSRESPGWLELPWTHGVHSGEPATVHLEAPEELNLHLHADGLPSARLVGCDAGRCIHQFTAGTGAEATPLRVRIDKPGRYEFRVSHASDTRQVREHFVVEAKH